MNWDSLLFLDRTAFERGYSDGIELSQLVSTKEGYKLGYFNGKTFGIEIGFYIKYAREITSCIEKSESFAKNSRLLKCLQQLLQMAEEYPATNKQDISMMELMEKMRAKFRLAQALAQKISSSHSKNHVESVEFSC